MVRVLPGFLLSVGVLVLSFTLSPNPQTTQRVARFITRPICSPARPRLPVRNRGLTEWNPSTGNRSATSLPALHARGVETITSIYGTLWPAIFRSFGPHRRQVGLHELTVVYGLYLADFTQLSALETEVVAFTNITCQGLRGPSLWHVRGLGRVLGARGTDEESARMRRVKDVLRGVKVAVATAVEWVGEEMVVRSRLDGGRGGGQGWPNVGDVVRELGGWGDDE